MVQAYPSGLDEESEPVKLKQTYIAESLHQKGRSMPSGSDEKQSFFCLDKLGSLTRLSGLVTALLIFGIMIAVMVSVILRYIFNSPVAGIDEIVSYVFSVCVFLGLAYTLRVDGHINVDLLLIKRSLKTQLKLRIIGYIVGLLVSGTMVYFGYLQVIDSYKTGLRSWSPLKTPVYLAQIGIPLGFLLFFLELILKILQSKRHMDLSKDEH